MFGFGNYGNGSGGDADPTRPRTTDDYIEVVANGFSDGDNARLRDAYENLRYSQGYFDDMHAAKSLQSTMTADPSHFEELGSGSSDVRWDKAKFQVGAPVMRRVVEALTENLYRRAPTRHLRDKQVTDLLTAIYRKNGMGPRWQRADQFSTIGGFAAFQFAGSDDPACPLKIHLWSADQLVPFEDDDDPQKVYAVATVDQVDGRTRVRLWTEDKVVTFSTRRDQYTATGQARKFHVLNQKDNPYRDANGKGIVPFSFLHFDYPATEFAMEAPGTNLKHLNQYINFALDDTADGIRYITKPLGIAEGVDPSWQAPAVIRPGMFLNLAGGAIDAGGNGPQPRLSYLENSNTWVGVIWSHLNNYLDLSLELNNVPPSVVRMVLDARSGVSILAEKAPLLGYTEERRRSFFDYEQWAAVKALQVLAAHLRNHGRDGKRFDEVALDPGFAIKWPRLYIDLPGPERDRADGVRVASGQASLIDLVMEREDCTREQAIETLDRVVKDNAELTAKGINPVPACFTPGQPPSYAPLTGAGATGATPGDDNPQDLNAIASSGINNEPVDANAQADSLSGEGG